MALGALVGAQESGLPGMPHPRLNAPRILRLQKVATYAQGRMQEQGHRFTLAPVYWDMPAAAAAGYLPPQAHPSC